MTTLNEGKFERMTLIKNRPRQSVKGLQERSSDEGRLQQLFFPVFAVGKRFNFVELKSLAGNYIEADARIEGRVGHTGDAAFVQTVGLTSLKLSCIPNATSVPCYPLQTNPSDPSPKDN